MAAKKIDIDAQSRKIMKDVENGIFSPVYLLMGTEPYYPDLVCDAIVKNALADYERDFNQFIWYGMDVAAEEVGAQARSYPVMAERRLLVIRDAQNMEHLEDLALYCEDPMDSTVLVILMHGASCDKRRALYKNISKNGIVLESEALKDYQMEAWVNSFYKGRGLSITPDAAALLVESAGTSMKTIAGETDKMLKNLPEGTTLIKAEDIEKNVGISRSFSIFELTKALSYKDSAKSIRIASHLGAAPGFYILVATAALFTHFNRILKYEAFLVNHSNASPAERAKVVGINPYFIGEYDAAVRNYPLQKCLQVIGLLEEYDFKGKVGMAGEAGQQDLLMELVIKILS